MANPVLFFIDEDGFWPWTSQIPNLAPSNTPAPGQPQCSYLGPIAIKDISRWLWQAKTWTVSGTFKCTVKAPDPYTPFYDAVGEDTTTNPDNVTKSGTFNSNIPSFPATVQAQIPCDPFNFNYPTLTSPVAVFIPIVGGPLGQFDSFNEYFTCFNENYWGDGSGDLINGGGLAPTMKYAGSYYLAMECAPYLEQLTSQPTDEPIFGQWTPILSSIFDKDGTGTTYQEVVGSFTIDNYTFPLYVKTMNFDDGQSNPNADGFTNIIDIVSFNFQIAETWDT